jgi:hypothetical protein
LLATFLMVGCTAGDRAAPPADDPLLPGGYKAVVDTDRGDPGHLQLELEKDLLHVTTGPAGIAWRPGDVVERGDFLAEATFTSYGAPPGYREAYGIFVGGDDLEGPDRRYTYLLVRPTGEFQVRQRAGAAVDTPVDWTQHTAVQRVSEHGDEPVNILGILAVGDEVRFLVNGTVVHRMPTAQVNPYGIAGLRVNHRLDLRVASWYLGAPPLTTPPAGR